MEYKAIFSLKTGQYNTTEDNTLCIIKDEVLLLDRITKYEFDANDIKNQYTNNFNTKETFRHSHTVIDSKINKIYINQPQIIKIPQNKYQNDSKKVVEVFNMDFEFGENLRYALRNIVHDFLLLCKSNEWFILLSEKAIIKFYTNTCFYSESFNNGYMKKEESNTVDVLVEFHKMINNQENTFKEICDKIKFN